MDIGSKHGYPASTLSNFSPHPFEFDGVPVASMEGLLQAFKFDKPHIQAEVCKLVGFAAKKRGKDRNHHWWQRQTLWWNGVEYDRHGKEYQQLLDRAYERMAAMNPGFRKALLATGDAVLTHSIGSSDPKHTVLTEREFCRRLTRLREGLKSIGRTAENP